MEDLKRTKIRFGCFLKSLGFVYRAGKYWTKNHRAWLKRIKLAARLHNSRPRYAVVGCGPIGHIAAQILAHRGENVTVFDRNPIRLAPFQGGPIHVGQDGLTGIEQFDIIIEATGDLGALDTMLSDSKPGATYLLLGFPYARHAVSFEAIVANDMAILGSVGSSAAEFAEAIRLLPSLPLAALTEHVVPFEDCVEVLAQFKAGHHVKTLLQISA